MKIKLLQYIMINGDSVDVFLYEWDNGLKKIIALKKGESKHKANFIDFFYSTESREIRIYLITSRDKRSGVGSLMLKQLEVVSKKLGAIRIIGQILRQKDEATDSNLIKFYLKNGFKIDGDKIEKEIIKEI